MSQPLSSQLFFLRQAAGQKIGWMIMTTNVHLYNGQDTEHRHI